MEAFDTTINECAFISNTIDAPHLASRLHHTYPFQYSLAEAEAVVREYVRFLLLKIAFSDFEATELSPSAYIDKAWHLHVLQTNRYASDCISICGRVIHHNADAVFAQLELVQLRRQRTRLLYKKVFGSEPAEQYWGSEQHDRSKTSSRIKVTRRKSF